MPHLKYKWRKQVLIATALLSNDKAARNKSKLAQQVCLQKIAESFITWAETVEKKTKCEKNENTFLKTYFPNSSALVQDMDQAQDLDELEDGEVPDSDDEVSIVNIVSSKNASTSSQRRRRSRAFERDSRKYSKRHKRSRSTSSSSSSSRLIEAFVNFCVNLNKKFDKFFAPINSNILWKEWKTKVYKAFNEPMFQVPV